MEPVIKLSIRDGRCHCGAAGFVVDSGDDKVLGVNRGLVGVIRGDLIMQNHVQQGFMYPDAPVVFNEAKLTKAVHKKAYA
jgi:hypothetical protein